MLFHMNKNNLLKVFLPILILGILISIFFPFSKKHELVKETEVIELNDGDTLNLEATIVEQEVGNRKIKRLAYNRQIPGPVIKVQKGSTITVNLKNSIDVETTLHSHGLRLDNKFDGVPDVTQDPIEVGETFTYTITFPDEGVYWYHPHIREDYTQELGLYGNYIVEGAEDYWNKVNQEEYLILDDFLENEKFDPDFVTHTLMGRFGNVLLINDKRDFSVEVEAGQINRFFITNVANTRVFDIEFEGANTKVVGGDIGRIQNEFFTESTVIAPAERYILELLYEKTGIYEIVHRGKKIGQVIVKDTDKTSQLSSFKKVRNNNDDYKIVLDDFQNIYSRQPDKSLNLNIEMGAMGQMGQGGMKGMDHSSMGHGSAPLDVSDFEGIENSADGIEWEDTMSMMNEMSDEGNIEWQIIDNKTGKKNMMIDWSFKKGDLVKVRIFNDPNSMHPMQHPIHFHGQRFVVLSRDGVENSNLQWKDTTLIPSGQTVDILVEMSNPGIWMAHCHIAEHLHAGMMFGFEVK